MVARMFQKFDGESFKGQVYRVQHAKVARFVTYRDAPFLAIIGTIFFCMVVVTVVIIYGSLKPFTPPATCDEVGSTSPSIYMNFHGGVPRLSLFTEQNGINSLMRLDLSGKVTPPKIRSKGVTLSEPRGMTLFQGRLFVIMAASSYTRILQYSCCNNGGYRDLLTVAPSYSRSRNPGLVHPYSLAVDAQMGHLYVSAQDTGEVLRYDITTNLPVPSPVSLAGVTGIDPGAFAIMPPIICGTRRKDNAVAPKKERVREEKGWNMTTPTSLGKWNASFATRKMQDSGLRGLTIVPQLRILLVILRCNMFYVIDLDTGEFLQKFVVSEPRQALYVPEMQQVYVTGRGGAYTFDLISPSQYNGSALPRRRLLLNKKMFRDPQMVSASGITSNGKSLWLVSHGLSISKLPLHKQLNNAMIEYDLASHQRASPPGQVEGSRRVPPIRRSPIRYDDFPETIMYSPC